MVTNNITYFIFELKNPRMLILWEKNSSMSKIAATLARLILVVIFAIA